VFFVVFLLCFPFTSSASLLVTSLLLLLSPLSPVKMDDLLTLRTSDGASVFADMIASSTRGDSVNLVETEKQLKPFVDALGGQLEAFEKLDEEGLEDFARLVDKYGFVFREEMLRKKIWCVYVLDVVSTKLTVHSTGTSLRVTPTLSAPSSFPPFCKMQNSLRVSPERSRVLC
jgi:hypothetical protein